MNERYQSIMNNIIGIFICIVSGLYSQVLPIWAVTGLGICGAILVLSEIWKISKNETDNYDVYNKG